MEVMLAFLGGMRVGRISARWRLLEGGLELALVMRGGGWAGQGYRPGTNKEDFYAKVYAIYRALDILDQR